MRVEPNTLFYRLSKMRRLGVVPAHHDFGSPSYTEESRRIPLIYKYFQIPCAPNDRPWRAGGDLAVVGDNRDFQTRDVDCTCYRRIPGRYPFQISSDNVRHQVAEPIDMKDFPSDE